MMSSHELINTEKRRLFIKKSMRIFAFFKPYWKTWLFLFFVSLLLSALGLANPLIVKFLIDNVLIAKNYELLKILMFVFIGLTLFTTAVRIVMRYAYRKLELSILYDVRNKLFSHIEEMGMDFFQKKKMGDLLTRLGNDISGIEEFISLAFNGFVANLLSLVILLIISLYLNWEITVIALAIVPFYIASQHLYAGRLRVLYNMVKRQSAAFMSFLEEKLSAMALVQLFGREEYELQREKQRMTRLISANLKTTLTSSFAGTIIGLLTFTALLFVLWYGGYQVITGTLTLGSLIAIYSYLGGLFSPLETLVGLYTAVQSSLASVDRVFQILDTKPSVAEKPSAPALPPIQGSIVFDRVSFAYDRQLILNDISFNIAPGKVIGIVGGSGSGKTTIVNLIARFYDPKTGVVRIDKHNARDVDLQSLRRQIGVAGQHVTLFNATVRENLLYGKTRGAGMEDVERAAKEAMIHDVVVALPKKYQTRLGEKGMTLSGGERQRLALARLILKNPRIIILDEATSFLDFQTELAVMRNIHRVFSGRTMVIVAHRLSTLEYADKILVLKNGRIIEEGTFQALLERGGEFFKFYHYQVGGFKRFEEKLELEFQRALAEKTPLLLFVIMVKNINAIVKELGEREALALLGRVSQEIAVIASPPAFSGQNADHRELFYVAVPGAPREQAQDVGARIISHLAKRIPDALIGVSHIIADEHFKTAMEALGAAKRSHDKTT